MKKIYTLIIATAFLNTGIVFSQCETATSLVVDMRFSNSNADSSGYNQSVFLYGSPTFGNDRNGNPNSALNTSNGTVFLDNSVSGEFKAQFPFTFSGWVYANALGARNPVFMNEDHATAYSGAWISILQTGEVFASIGNGGGAGATSRKTATTNNQVISAGNWQHIAVVFNSLTDMKIYVDGVLQAVTYSGTGNSLYYYMISGTAGKIGSGVNGVGTNAYFNGLVDDFKFWTVALVDQQIEALHDSHVNYISNSNEGNNLCNNGSIELSAPNVFCDYNWSNGGNSATSTVSGSILGVGSHTIYASMFDNQNIQYTDSINLVVSNCTGINEAGTEEGIFVYPNPTNGTFIIETSEKGFYSLTNIIGEIITTFKVQQKQVFNIQNLHAGIYFITELNSGKTTKLVKE